MPLMIFFSFYPMINLGMSHGMHFEISLLEAYLVLFVLVNLSSIWRNRVALLRSRAVQLVFVFCAFSTLSLFWTPNFIKGFLICGILWLLFGCFLAFASYPNLKKLLPTLFKVLIFSACLMAVFGFFQIFAEIIGLPQNISLLCDGCLARELGFTRITGFAIEPQFFGSLLLAPVLLLLHKFISAKSDYKLNLCLALLLVAVFLTLSRGAIYALAIGILVLIFINRKNFKRVFFSLAIVLGTFILSLAIQGASVELNPKRTGDNFYSAISRVIHQLSLGIVDIRPHLQSNSSSPEEQTPSIDSSSIVAPGEPILPPDSPILDGYVEESTNIRNLLTKLSLQAWAKTPANVVFGTGVGSTGFVLHRYFPDQVGDTEITQNQYTETLLENGLIGFSLFAALIVLLFRATRKHQFLWAIFAAFLVQWLFFSGYPNALHVYLFCLLCTAHVSLKPTRRPRYAF